MKNPTPVAPERDDRPASTPSVDEIITDFADRGIVSLEDYVRSTLAATAGGSDPNTHGDCLARDALRTSFTVAKDKPITHVPPAVQLTIDGVVYDPADIVRHNGTPLHFVAYGKTLAAFTEPRIIKAAIADGDFGGIMHTMGLTVGPDGQPFYQIGGSTGGSRHVTPPWQVNYGSLKMFSDINWGGDWFWLEEGWAWRDLTRVWRNKVLFFHGDWNDVISSVTCTASAVTYYEHIHFQGSTLTIPGHQPQDSRPNLHTVGWGDRISSVAHWPS